MKKKENTSNRNKRAFPSTISDLAKYSKINTILIYIGVAECKINIKQCKKD